MYIPPPFAETDLAKLHDAIEQYSFATLVSSTDAAPTVTHLPLLLDRQRGERGTLIGHMARANQHWEQMDDRPVTAIFHGPHAYISPAWYEAKNVVPTWNYVAVHAEGCFHLIDQREAVLEIVKQYVERYERDRMTPWKLITADADFVDQLLDGIVGFEIPIDRIEGKWKLNQNHDCQRREFVAKALRAAGGDARMEIAELIERTV